jgi:hypothetical protein
MRIEVETILGVARRGNIEYVLLESLSIILVQRNLELERLLVRCEALELPSCVNVSIKICVVADSDQPSGVLKSFSNGSARARQAKREPTMKDRTGAIFATG